MDQTMNQTEQVKEIDLMELWDVFVYRLPIILLAAVIAVSGFFAFTCVTYEAEYSSTATLYILRQNEDTQSAATAYNEITLASKVVNDCTHMLKSRSVVEPVIEELGLDMTYSELYSKISTNNPSDTRILEVVVRGESPEIAKQIVDLLCEIGQEKIAQAMGYQQVNLFEYGTLPVNPSNRTGLKTYALVGAAAAVLTYVVYVVIYLLDDRIRTDEDVERLLGLSVLADIPDLNADHKNKYGYNKYGYGYGYGQRPTKKRKTPAKGKTSVKEKN